MGCACGKPLDSVVVSTGAKPSYHQRVSVGRPLGGGAMSDGRRELQLAAAEKRAEEHSRRGLKGPRKACPTHSGSTITAGRLDLLGRVRAEYKRLGKEEPFGLNLASEEQLLRHLEALKGSPSVPIS